MHQNATCYRAIGLGPGDFVLEGDPAPPGPKGAHTPNFGQYLLRPNGCMDQDVTWYGAIGLGPGDFVLDEDPAPLPKRGGAELPFPIFGPCLLCPNGWMDEAGTLDGGRPQPRRLCVRWGPSPSPKGGGAPIQFSAHFYCGQTAGCIKMPLSMDVSLSPGYCVRCRPSCHTAR